jgi:hypothetical protein
LDSVPYRFARSEVEVRLTGRTVEIFVKGERIAVHMRSSGNGKHTTTADHMPSSHRRYADWTIGRIRRDAALVGPATAALCDLILERRPHPEQGFRSCLGILRLVRSFGVARLEAAAARAIEIGALTCGSGAAGALLERGPQCRHTRTVHHSAHPIRAFLPPDWQEHRNHIRSPSSAAFFSGLLGLVASLNRPGANLTGIANLGTELGPKQLQLLRELATSFGIVPQRPSGPTTNSLTHTTKWRRGRCGEAP